MDVLEEKTDIGGIGLDGIFGKAPLGDEIVQKGFSDRGKLFRQGCRFDELCGKCSVRGGWSLKSPSGCRTF